MTANWVRSFVPPRLDHWARLLTDRRARSVHREMVRLLRAPRRRRMETTLLGRPFVVTDALTFWGIYSDIFVQEPYRFACETQTPLIIDGGANVGVSTLYFKRLFPRSRVIAFEADPQTFAALAENCRSFELADVEVVPKALWTCDTTLAFEQEGCDAGRIVGQDAADGNVVRVEACRLADYLTEPVDLLKLDIEGAETEVLLDCGVERLGNVKRLFVEHHSYVGKPQRLDELVSLLTRSGFRLHIKTNYAAAHPFVEVPSYRGMETLLNIYAVREGL